MLTTGSSAACPESGEAKRMLGTFLNSLSLGWYEDGGWGDREKAQGPHHAHTIMLPHTYQTLITVPFDGALVFTCSYMHPILCM